MPDSKFFAYLAVMAGVTYLIRMLPAVLVKKKITNRFIVSFLHYMPYAVLAAMTVPAVFFSTGNTVSAAIGFAAAVVLALCGKGLLTVAAVASAGVLISELVAKLFF